MMSVTINWSAVVGISASNVISSMKKARIILSETTSIFLTIFHFLKQEVKRKTLKTLPRTLLNVS